MTDLTAFFDALHGSVGNIAALEPKGPGFESRHWSDKSTL
jgi:hypothetical protein